MALAVLAIGMAVTVMAFRPDPARQLGQEAERLALLLEQAEDESALGGAPLAWVARVDGYEFQRRTLNDTGPNWITEHGDDLLHPRRLPEAARIEAALADTAPLAFGERAVLGEHGIQNLSVVLALGEARMRVERQPDGRYRHVEVSG